MDRCGVTSLAICLVTDEILGPFRNGGIGTACTGLAEQLALDGHRVTILYAFHDHDGPRCMSGSFEHWQEVYRGIGIDLVAIVSVDTIPDDWADPRFASLRIYNWLKDKHFDAVCFNDYGAQSFHCLVAKHLGIAFTDMILTIIVHGSRAWLREISRTPYGNRLEVQHAWMERRCIELADFLISPSAYLMDWMRKQGWSLPRSARVIPNLMPTISFGRLFGTESAGTPLTGPAPAGPVSELVFFGRLEFRKGIFLFLEALALLRGMLPADRIPSIAFLGKFTNVWGMNTGAEVLWRLSDWPADVRLLSRLSQAEALDYIHQPGRLAVVPSLAENSPCTVFECLLGAIPLVASDTGGIPELVAEEDRRRILFAPTAPALAATLKGAVLDGLRPARPRHSREEVVASWRAWHRELAAGRRTGRVPSSTPLAALARSAGPPDLSSRSEDGIGAQLATEFPWRAPVMPPATGSPLVSVVVVHFNRPRLLDRALDSLRRQTYGNIEIIVVDDGSTLPEATAYLDRLAGAPPVGRLRLIRQENRYLGAARNAGARISTGKYLLFMDDDNVALPWEIETLAGAAEHSGADILTCLALFFDEGTEPSCEIAQIHYVPVGQCLPAGLLGNVFGDANCLIRRTAYEALGGFAEEYGFGCNDYDLFLRAAIAGFRQEVVPEPLYFYQISNSSMFRTSHPSEDIARIYDRSSEAPLALFKDAFDLFINDTAIADHIGYIRSLLSKRPHGAHWGRLATLDPNSTETLRVLRDLAIALGRPDRTIC